MDNNIDKEKLINDFIASSGKKEYKLSISDEEANIELDCSYEEIQNIALAFSNHHGIYQCSLCKQIFNLPADYDDYNVRLCKECNDKVVFPLPKNVEEELAKYKEYSTKDFYRNLDYLKNKYEDNNRLIVYLIYNIDKRKYYIGESRGNVAERIQSHFEGNGNVSLAWDYNRGDNFSIKIVTGAFISKSELISIFGQRRSIDLLKLDDGSSRTLIIHGYNEKSR